MRYYIDTEFIEGFHKPLFGKRRHFIDLISIGIVAEDGREYSAISNEYRYKDANDWVKENVISPLYTSAVPGWNRQFLHVDSFHKKLGKSNVQIAKEIMLFINPHKEEILPVDELYRKIHNVGEYKEKHNLTDKYCFAQPDFYGYYADYDWVLFCSLFGTMMDLPTGFPMYMRDLKQMLDAGADSILRKATAGHIHVDSSGMSMDKKIEYIKTLPGYPVNTNEHSAIADARWNRNLHKFLLSKG